MGVVVDDRDLALVHLEAPARAGEPLEGRGGILLRDTGEPERRERRTAFRRLCSPGTAEPTLVGGCSAHDLRHTGEPTVELPLELGEGCVLGVVVELQVRDHRDLRRQLEHRAVRLVRLDDEVPAPEAGVRPELGDRGADQPRRVAPSRATRTRSSPPSSPSRASR